MKAPESNDATMLPQRRRSAAAALLISFVPAASHAAEYWVAPDGSDSNAGTEDEPFETVGRGQEAASAGDTVWVRGGTWSFSSGTVGVAFNKAGQEGNPIQYFAVERETPVFDLSGIANPSGRVTGFDVQTNYVHIRGMEITGVPQYMSGEDSWALRIRGNGNVIERMNIHHNEAPGIFITSGSDNLVLNCDSHHNYDVLENGGSGDGFGCHSTGQGNVISGCRGWYNSDDGYDFINAPGACVVENSWAWRNGYVPDTMTAAGNGSGFKAGGFGLDTSTFPSSVPRHVVTHCLAFGNRAQGFYANHHPGGIDFFNNTAVDNATNFDMLADVGESDHTIRNNLAFGNGGTISRLTGGTDESNSWNLGVTVSGDDFVSEMEAEAEAPRQADGSLPDIGFMHLVAGSDLIDQGEDVGLPFAGDAPDLGCFEVGLDDAGEPGTGGMPNGEGGMGSGEGGSDDPGGGGMPSGAAGAPVGGADDPGAGGSGASAGGDASTPSNGGNPAAAGAPSVEDGGEGNTPVPAPGPTSTSPAPTASPNPGVIPAPSPNTAPSGTAPAATSSAPVVTDSDATEDPGCGCRIPARSGNGRGAMLSVLGLIAALRRRRSRR